MPRTIYVSMLPYNWRTSFDMFQVKVMRLLKLCTPPPPSIGDNDPLHIVIASEYMFRKNPMGAVKDKEKSFFMRNDTAKTKTSNPVNFYSQSYGHTFYSAAEKEELIRQLCLATAGKNIMVVAGSMMWINQEPKMGTVLTSSVKTKGEVFNSTFIVHKGALVHNYNKNKNIAEIDDFEKKLFNYSGGSEMGGSFQADDLSFGVEICADNGLLLNDRREKNIGGVDVHLLVSDGAGLANPAARTGGYVVQCDRSVGQVYKALEFGGKRQKVPALGDLTWTLALD